MSDARPANGIDTPLTYNPAKDDAKLREMLTVPAESYGVPSRWIRCMAAEILELRASATAEAKQRQAAVDALLDIAAMGKKAGSELAKNRLTQMGIDWETGEPAPNYGSMT
jgi:hypothetical protein